MDNRVIVTNIQRFSLHDGPGIRTTVFMKGCSIRCPWCSNPENISCAIQKYKNKDAEGVYGKYLSINELYDEIIKDKSFYLVNCERENEQPGGVTFSGGESLLQMTKIEPLLKRLHDEKIHIAIETSLFSDLRNLKIAIKYIDLFYVDLKILNYKKCADILKGNLDEFYYNLDYLVQSGKYVVFRIPVIAYFTDDQENIMAVSCLIKKYIVNDNVIKVELLKEHNLGISKYKALRNCNDGINIPVYHGITDDFMEEYKRVLTHHLGEDVLIEICKI